jgi:hypothetical protein
LSGIGTAFAKCQPVGHKCNHDHQCCSGTCQNGKCAIGLSCVTLSNGTCAKPCSKDSDCPKCGAAPYCVQDVSTGATYCAGADTGIVCTSGGDSDCPSGQFCKSIAIESVCTVAC